MRNVVLLTFDSLRADHCGYMGYERNTTPNLDALAAEGTAFTNAVSPASRTNPSMSGILTGEPLVWRDEVANAENSRGHLERERPIQERLGEQGYATGAFCPNAYASSYYGFDRGFDRFEDFLFGNDLYQELFDRHLGDSTLFTWARNLRNYARKQEAFKTWDTYVDEMVEWIEAQSEPFFCWAFSLDPHFPYIAPRQDREWGNLPAMYYYNWLCNKYIGDLDVDPSDRAIQRMIDIYDDSIRFGDRFIGELRDRLAEYDPVFVVHGDHGEAFFERDVYGHFYPSLYEENIHVPFVVSEGDETVAAPATMTDLPDVIADLAASGGDFDPPRREWVTATDFDAKYGERGDRNLVAVRTERWKYILTEDGDRRTHELYDLDTDPGETVNRAGEEVPVESTLRSLAERRLGHEDHVVSVRERAPAIAGDDASAGTAADAGGLSERGSDRDGSTGEPDPEPEAGTGGASS